MKKLFIAIICLVACLGFMGNVRADDKVKVYIFEAGGCPYCEKEIEYLQGLDSYNKKFEIVRKELYVDHVDWEQGADYELGYNVATLFQEKGFSNASYQGTPFVVISNIYAAAAYSEELESVIEEAYKKGDVDVVGCVEKKGENCFIGGKSDTDNIGYVIVFLFVVVGIIAMMFYAKNKMSVENVEEKPVKKETSRKRK